MLGIHFLLFVFLPPVCGEENHPGTNEVTAAVLSDFPPLYVLDDKGKPAGFAIDILNRVAEKSELSVHYLVVENWAAAMEAVRTGRADLIPGIGISETRSSEFLFSDEVETIPVSCFVRAKNYAIDGITSLNGQHVAVIEKSAAETKLKNRTEIKLVSFPNIDSALIQLLTGDVDAFVFPEPVLWKKARDAGVADKIKVVGLPLMELKRGFLLRRTDTDLLQKINQGIQTYVRSGDYLADYAKWYGKTEPFWNLWRIVSAMSGLVILVIVGMAGWRYYSVVQFSRQLNNNIAIRLKAEKALQKAHAELEQRVADRTKELKEEKEKAQKYFDIAGVMLGALNRAGEVTLINQKGCQILGVTEDEVIGKNWFDHYLPGSITKATKEVFRKLMAGETAAAEYYENPVLTSDGSQQIIAFHNILLTDEKGQIKGVLFSGLDITERKRAEVEKARIEVQLRQSLKMEAIGTLAGGIAHDFNNILSAIIGYSEIAIEDLPSDSRVVMNLRKVLKAGFRARDLVKQILAFSRQANIDPVYLRPASIIKEGIKLLRSSIPVTIEIYEDIDPATGVIMADPTQLHQILMNLCTNAFHAMEYKGGRLEISLHEVVLGRETLDNELGVAAGTFAQLTVHDSGTGIDPAIRNNIFDPYFTTKEAGKGTGMGLAIIHGIVKNYGGFISCESELGRGTTFKAFLPVVKQDTPADEEILDGIATGTEEILFVDDEVQIADMAKEILQRLGYAVTLRKSSIEALEAFHNQPEKFDLVITDQTMPGMTGIELSRRMLQIRPDLPIILCTGYSSTVSEAEARFLGIKEFAFKPISIRSLARLIRKVLDR
ncbi:MAG: transporter substrate-binding domain-containing protein [Proteobacteria bacterium]|nr:transporter substrate-binding domain-containing protein [Pseudomonadota bacterium]MBU4296359.1 transporter substrate-binding domain-containing protein [Pseudomonadota bacterium]MCG2749226.1 transporter substrate-binding domain-containing protein [Desulfobulbaceae bacterium]